MSIAIQLGHRLRNIGVGQVKVIKRKSILSSWGGHPTVRTIVTEINKITRYGYLHTVVDKDRVIVVRLRHEDPKPGRDYDERLKNEN